MTRVLAFALLVFGIGGYFALRGANRLGNRKASVAQTKAAVAENQQATEAALRGVAPKAPAGAKKKEAALDDVEADYKKMQQEHAAAASAALEQAR